MSASFTRIIGERNERVELPLEDTIFRARKFTVSRSGNGWTVDPGKSDNVVNVISLNGKAVSGPRPLVDDDLIRLGNEWWIFRAGPIARNEDLERVAIEQSGASLKVVADWLIERGDLLGERISSHWGHRSDAPALPFDAFMQPTQLEFFEEHGLIKTLKARAHVDETELLLALMLRRTRFLEHLVIDASPEDIVDWVGLLGSWPLPRWLRTLSLGTYLGARPKDWGSDPSMAPLKERCPLLGSEPTFTWNAKPTLLVEKHSVRVDGISPGESRSVSSGLTIERQGDRVSVHSSPRGPVHHAMFFMNQRHVFLNPALGGPITEPWITRSRARLLHDDLIEAAPGIVFRFRLRD